MESVARIVKVEVPVAVGVPEITPAEVTVRPGGSVPVASAHVEGGMPPVAASVAE